MILKLKLQYFGHLMRRVDSLEKTDAGRDWGPEEKGMTEDEMAWWHHWLDGCESEWTAGVGDGQGAWCAVIHGVAKSRIQLSNWTELNWTERRLQQYMSCELPDVQAGFRKGREPENKLPTSAGSSKKQESSRKTSISALLTKLKPLILWITINCGKF